MTPPDVRPQTTDDIPASLLSLSSMFSETRYTLRLFGTIHILNQYMRFWHDSQNNHNTNPIDFAQLLTLATYQSLENYAFLASKRLLPQRWTMTDKMVNRCFVWGARALVLHFLLELFKLGREIRIRNSLGPIQVPRNEQLSDSAEVLAWWKRLFSTSVWGILCLHWSFPPGSQLLATSSGGFSFLADFFSFQELWEKTLK
ncbi:unnamed protein product [Penicillium salamii]|uniref:Uncharacterized protein n=1 Tax=Penicillium salamii TaxID=1612424 RepID=A0A9W4NFA2_9EURO|nr:unnamed protein product [Penicillium salamii]CAG8010672.1 unnamed protein product [Penicillium salamii]CAG8021535.1 unnamed protein product [Penicillium salamii]CAG8120241.1 unnamed protein product [Penicillium salamii]CAG8153940.1 unnamed protein product [Penicillium salamii]